MTPAEAFKFNVDGTYKRFFETELAAGLYIDELRARGIEYSYFHESCCRFWVKIL